MTALSTTPDLNRFFGERGNDYLDRAVAALVGKLPIQEIWLFGSCARGDARPDSDLDLLAVLEDGHSLKRPTAECFQTLFRLRNVVPTDIVALSKSEWEWEKAHPFGMYGEIAREGICIYEK
jgi:uncharacterized protein